MGSVFEDVDEGIPSLERQGHERPLTLVARPGELAYDVDSDTRRKFVFHGLPL